MVVVAPFVEVKGLLRKKQPELSKIEKLTVVVVCGTERYIMANATQFFAVARITVC